MRTLFALLILLLTPIPTWAQCPTFPARGVQVIDALYDGKLAWGDDDARRALTKIYIEQLVYDFPMEGWTWKSADPGRPPSKDSIARIYGGRLCNWDWQNGTTRERVVRAGDIGTDITGQTPIPVAGVNRMVTAPPAPTPTPTPPTGVTYEGIRTIVHDEVQVIWAQNERTFANLIDNLNAIAGKQDAFADQLKAHDEKTSKIVAFFSDPKTITAVISSVLAYITARKM